MSKATAPRLSIVVLSDGAWTDALGSVRSVITQHADSIELLVQGYGDSLGLQELARRLDGWVRVDLLSGAARADAMNRAATLASGQFILFLEAPSVLIADRLERFVNELQADDSVVYGPVMISDGVKQWQPPPTADYGIGPIVKLQAAAIVRHLIIDRPFAGTAAPVEALDFFSRLRCEGLRFRALPFATTCCPQGKGLHPIARLDDLLGRLGIARKYFSERHSVEKELRCELTTLARELLGEDLTGTDETLELDELASSFRRRFEAAIGVLPTFPPVLSI